LKTFCSDVALISATKLFGSGGTGSGQYSPRRSENAAPTADRYFNGRWHLGEVFARINGKTQYLWPAVDHKGEVLGFFATKRRNRKAALKFLKRAMKRYGEPRIIVTDRLRSYRAGMKVIGNAANHKNGGRLNNRAEGSHQPFRRREGALSKFGNVKTVQKFASVRASIHNHFNLDRHLNSRTIFKQDRAAALVEWRNFAA